MKAFEFLRPLGLVSLALCIEANAASQQHLGGNPSRRVPIPRPHSDALFPAEQFKVGTGPRAVAAGDLDGDGDLDLVTANFTTGTVSVLQNFGNGSFADAASYSAGVGTNQVRAVALGDVDGDGDLDVVVASYGSSSFKLFKNNGDATLAPLVSYAMGTNPTSIQLGDLDGDGDLDVAVTNFTSNTVSIRKNAGNGTFGAGPAVTSYATGTGPNSVALVDVDGDTDLDLAVANTSSSSVTVHLNNGNGTFAAAVSYAAGNGSSAVAAADLDGDTDQDLVVTTFSGTDCVVILKNNGDGTFAAAYGQGPVTGLVAYARSVAIGDFDGDSDADLAVVKSRDDGDLGSLSILENDGTGAFTFAVAPLSGFDPRSVAAADLDGKNGLDLVVAHYASNAVSVLKNDGSGSMRGARPSPVVNDNSYSGPTIADLDGDSDLDVAISGRKLNDSPTPMRVWAFENAGMGTFPTETSSATLPGGTSSPSPSLIGHGDLDGDTDVDLVVVYPSFASVYVLRNVGDGTFLAPEAHAVGVNPQSVAIGDVDGDLDLDLVVANRLDYSVSVLLNDGAGNFPTTTAYGPGSGRPNGDGPRIAHLADVDGDLDRDIVVCAGGLGVWVFLNNGDGTFATEIAYDGGGAVNWIDVGDLDGDGDIDIAAVLFSPHALTVLSNQGDGTFAAPTVYPRADEAKTIAIADLDGDQRLDLVISTANATVGLYRNVGGGSFVATSEHHVGASSGVILIGDIDGDGDLDLLSHANAGEAGGRGVIWTLHNQRIP